MRAEECPRLDKCLVKSLFSRDWESDAELAAAIRELCETCPEQPYVLLGDKGNRATMKVDKVLASWAR